MWLIRAVVNALSRRQRRAVQLAFDIFILSFCVWLAFQLRLGFGHNFTDAQIISIAIAPIIGIPIFIRFGLYRAVLRYIPNMALWTIIQAIGLTTTVWAAAIFLVGFYGGEGVPRSIPIIFALLAFAITLVSRFAAQQIIYWERARDRKRYAIYGAGAAGLQYAQALTSAGEVEVCALFDDDRDRQKMEFHGVKCYPPNQIADWIKRLGIESIVICLPSISGQRRLEIAASLAKYDVKVQTLPSLGELVDGKYRVEPFDNIDLNELLGRSPVPPDLELVRQSIANKTILVTGAGGSIGSQLVRTLATYGAASIIMVDHSEFALFEVDRKMRAETDQCILVPVLASVLDEKAMREVFETYHPNVVFHAAAYKHVALAERNSRAVFENNVLGTKTLLEMSERFPLDTFVFISTDKAVNPTSVMGATKRLGELLVRHHAEISSKGRTYLSVRFGNVIGSQGSVIPIFKEQIRRGGPVTVRGRGTNRYFMAISEACELIIQSSGMAEGGETFLLKMGEPVSIEALARSMIKLSGLTVKSADRPDGDIEIKLEDIQPGEKTTEDLFYDVSTSVPTKHPKIVRAKKRTQAHLRVEEGVERIVNILANELDRDVRQTIFAVLDDCQNDMATPYSASVVNLDDKRKSG
ncbi:MAG: nucleoside-diphosphate sugar epimerase/dehydratase [Pseudomonadota bacterium]